MSRSARRGNGAVGAAVLAAVLDFDVGAGPVEVRDGHLLERASLQRAVQELGNRIFMSLRNQPLCRIHHRLLVGVPADEVHAGNVRNLMRVGLGKTAGDKDVAVRIGSDGTPDHLPRLAVGFRRHGAGVHNGDVADISFTGDPEALGGKALGNGFGFVLVDLTTARYKMLPFLPLLLLLFIYNRTTLKVVLCVNIIHYQLMKMCFHSFQLIFVLLPLFLPLLVLTFLILAIYLLLLEFF